jgi:NAD(P)-dependent dehydrogenase (short-subunit alcohol dehydrogenase family)
MGCGHGAYAPMCSARGRSTGRLGEADELAQAALYLASSDSSFVNGIPLHVDGGMSLV